MWWTLIMLIFVLKMFTSQCKLLQKVYIGKLFRTPNFYFFLAWFSLKLCQNSSFFFLFSLELYHGPAYGCSGRVTQKEMIDVSLWMRVLIDRFGGNEGVQNGVLLFQL